MSNYLASLAISTHNRKDEVVNAVDSALSQSLGDRLQVIVIDDGSSDGTYQLLTSRYGKFRNVILDCVQPGIGYVAERNRFPELCDAPYIFSIDDDAVLHSSYTIEQTIDHFRAHERIAAIAIPYIDVKIDPYRVRQLAPDSDRVWVSALFRGTAHALRKDVFVQVGRYRRQLWRQGEEGDLAVRLLDHGYVISLGYSDPIHHLESPKRSKSAIYSYTARNLIWFAWHNTPASMLPVQLAGTSAKLIMNGIGSPSRLGSRLDGLIKGYTGIFGQERGERRPVSLEAYKLYRLLKSGSPVPLEEIESRLPALG